MFKRDILIQWSICVAGCLVIMIVCSFYTNLDWFTIVGTSLVAGSLINKAATPA